MQGMVVFEEESTGKSFRMNTQTGIHSGTVANPFSMFLNKAIIGPGPESVQAGYKEWTTPPNIVGLFNVGNGMLAYSLSALTENVSGSPEPSGIGT